jgi:hypothetical protein
MMVRYIKVTSVLAAERDVRYRMKAPCTQQTFKAKLKELYLHQRMAAVL